MHFSVFFTQAGVLIWDSNVLKQFLKRRCRHCHVHISSLVCLLIKQAQGAIRVWIKTAISTDGFK